MRRGQGPGEDQDGFAAVDALVAVTILSTSLAMALVAAGIGARASHMAGEVRAAEMTLRDHLEKTAGRAGAWTGQGRQGDWRVEARLVEAGPALRAAPCVREASFRAASDRTYRIATVDICQAQAAG